MHPVLVNLFNGLADKIDEDPEKFERRLKTFKRRLKKKLNSPELKQEIKNVIFRAVAKKLRVVR